MNFTKPRANIRILIKQILLSLDEFPSIYLILVFDFDVDYCNKQLRSFILQNLRKE